MMEESSDESGEMISKEEAELAELQHTTGNSGQSDSGVLKVGAHPISLSPGGVAPPAPLPAFLTQGSPQPPGAPQAETHTVAVTPQKPVSTPVVTPSAPPMPPPQPSPAGPTTSASPVMGGVTTPVGGASPPPSWTSPSLGGTLPPPGTISPGSAMQPPGPVQSPYEASTSIQVPLEMSPEIHSPSDTSNSGSMFGWITGNKFMSKVVEKTKSGVESMITTLDPGMKEVILSGGDITIVVTSAKENKVGAVREAFQKVFGKATVVGEESQATTAAQPVGFTAGLKGAEERISNLRQSGRVQEGTPVISVEGFIVEMLPDRWYEMSCLVLQDPVHRIDLQTFSQPNLIPIAYILSAQDRTPADYPLRWSGLAVPIGQVVEETLPHIGHADWQNGIVGVSRRESLMLAAKSLAYMYRQRLPTSFNS